MWEIWVPLAFICGALTSIGYPNESKTAILVAGFMGLLTQQIFGNY